MSYFREMYVKTGFHMRITTATYCSTGNAGISVHLNIDHNILVIYCTFGHEGQMLLSSNPFVRNAFDSILCLKNLKHYIKI